MALGKKRYLAIDEHGNNYLETWLKDKRLFTPRESLHFKGKKDYVIFDVKSEEIHPKGC